MTHAQPWSTGWAGAWIASSNPIPLDELFLERTSHIMEAILIKSRRCVAHLYYTLNTELDSVDLVVKPSTTAEDTGRLTGTAAIPGSNTKSRFLRRQLFHIFLNSMEVLAFLEDFKSYRI